MPSHLSGFLVSIWVTPHPEKPCLWLTRVWRGLAALWWCLAMVELTLVRQMDPVVLDLPTTAWERRPAINRRRQKPVPSGEKHLKGVLASEWVADGGEGWGETLFLPCATQPQSSSDSLRDFRTWTVQHLGEILFWNFGYQHVRWCGEPILKRMRCWYFGSRGVRK